MEIIKFKNELNKAKKIIEQQKLTINTLQSQLNNINYKNINNNYIQIQSLQNIINQKEQEINRLKSQLNNNKVNNKELFSEDQIMVVNFISKDQKVHYAVPCFYNNTFVEVEEKLYKKFPEYRETNNHFLANGREILRFKTIKDNKIGDGFPVTLVKPY